MFKKIAVISGLIINSISITAQAQQTATIDEAIRWQAKLEEVKDIGNQSSPFLKLSKDIVLVESTALLHFINIQGQFIEKITQATLNSKEIPVKEDGSFQINFGFSIYTNTFTVTALGAKNKIYRTQFKVIPIEHKEVAVEKIAPKIWRFSAGAGLTRLSFRQRYIEPFDQNALTIKGGAIYNLIPEKIDLGLSMFFNAIALSSTSPANYKIQYLGANGRLVWNLVGNPSPVRINISAGLYYNTSLSTVGFANMYGPQLYPEFIYIFKNGNSLLAYTKYSPALSQAQLIELKHNREVAMGMHYSFPITVNRRMSVGVDISQLSLSIPNGSWASTNTYSLSAGVSF